jgi:hypothetical protein
MFRQALRPSQATGLKNNHSRNPGTDPGRNHGIPSGVVKTPSGVFSEFWKVKYTGNSIQIINTTSPAYLRTGL